jgi:hypothetical protein
MSDEAIVQFVREHTQEEVPTLVIARQFNGPKATRKTINPILYRLQREGKLEKVCEDNGAKPRWKIPSSLKTS